MKNYEEYLKTRLIPYAHRTYIGTDDKNRSDDVKYYAINGSDACAKVSVKSYREIELPDTVRSETYPVRTYTVRMVYVSSFDSNASPITIPNTVWSIYVGDRKYIHGRILFTFANSPYFSIKEDNGNWAVFSKEEGADDVHEELIYGRLGENNDGFLNGVKIIHNLTVDGNCCIPDSVEKIYKLSVDVESVIFEGKLPEFGIDALEDAKIDHIEVRTPKLENSRKSVDAIVNVKQTGDKTFYRRPEEDTLFAAAPHVLEFPKSKGYIALTRADFEHDGELLLVNTPWIATICPRRLLRSDGEVNGSTILIGLKDGNYNQERGGGIIYNVYEDPTAIDAMIANVQP